MIGVCEERRRSQNEAIKGHFIFGFGHHAASVPPGAEGFFFLWGNKIQQNLTSKLPYDSTRDAQGCGVHLVPKYEFEWEIYMANCYVRIWIPYDPVEDWGFYDLYIQGNVTIKGVTFPNPVFAYGTDSKLYIYPNERTIYNYPVNRWYSYTAYRYQFTCSSISSFQSNLSASIASFDESSNSSLVKCHLVSSNPFATCSRGRYNSFAAVAYWCNWLGNSILLDDYNTAHNEAYRKYLPEALKADSSIFSQWIPTTMNGT